jgi:ribosomal protein S18 acetylase RimI-like enzyme
MESTLNAEITLADHSHISSVMNVIHACTEAMRQAEIFQWDEIYPNREQIEEDVRGRTLYVALEKGICLGAVSLNEKQEDAYRQVEWCGAEPALVIHRLCVDPAFQGLGIAGQLMGFAEDLALQRGYASIRLDAYSGNPKAVALYENRGYRRAGQVSFPRRDLPFYCFEKIWLKRK